ncbi:MAG: zinc-ribbon domain-containing protein [Acidobacteria bacterium]|nr:zinc-ribbon domain-containing protein [Acidobacteriota bacterium]
MTEQSGSPEVKWGEWIGGGWQMFTERWQVWVPMMLVFILALIVPILPMYILLIGAGVASESGEAPAAAVGMLAPLVGIAGALITLCLASFMLGGIYRTAFKQMRGEAIGIGDLFSGKDVVVNLLITMFLIILCAMGGALLCIFPAFIVAGLLFFAIPLVVEKGLSPMDALRTSFEKNKGNWLMFTLFAFVVSLIGSIGQFACYIGLLVTYPLQFLITAVAYRDVFGVAGVRSASQIPSSYASPSWQQGGQASYMPPPPQYTPPQAPQSYAPPQPVPPPVMPPPAPVVSDQITCPNCNALLSRTAKFCNYCGKPL